MKCSRFIVRCVIALNFETIKCDHNITMKREKITIKRSCHTVYIFLIQPGIKAQHNIIGY